VNVRYHVYKDYQLETTGRTDEQIFEQNPHCREELVRKRFSFTDFAHDRRRGRLYLAAVNAGGDVLLEFDLAKKEFRSCGYAESGFRSEQEMRIHRGLWLDAAADALYFGTGTLLKLPGTIGTAGGKLVRYHLAEREFELLGAPTRGEYYQATVGDLRRKKIYMYTIPGNCFAVFDIEKRKLVRCDAVESVPHIGCLDDAGGVWGTWGFNRQAFFRYLPDEDRYEFPEGLVLPDALKAASAMYLGSGPVDAFINGGDGYLYVASGLGELYRLDPRQKKLDYLGKPFAGPRLPGVARGEDNLLYLTGGWKAGPTELARYDLKTGRLERLGAVASPDGESCWRSHGLIVVEGTVWIGEVDNPERSGWLWECAV